MPLEIRCNHCSKVFRVRPEFAGRSARCPSCSARISIDAPAQAAPVLEVVEKPSKRSRIEEVEEDLPEISRAWRSVSQGLKRIQTSLIVIAIQIALSFLGIFLLIISEAGRSSGPEAFLTILGVFTLVPLFSAWIFALLGRLACQKSPKDSGLRPIARISLYSILAMGLCFFLFTIAVLIRVEQRSDDLFLEMSLVGIFLFGLLAETTFVGFLAQLGAHLRRQKLGSAIGSFFVSIGWFSGIVISSAVVFGVIMAILTDGYDNFNPSYGYNNYSPSFMSGQTLTRIYLLILAVMLPTLIGMALNRYYRLIGKFQEELTNAPSPSSRKKSRRDEED